MRNRRTAVTPAQRKLLAEMADSRRVLLIQRNDRSWFGLRYTINAFPMRTVSGPMVARLARRGYLRVNRRGYYELTLKGMLTASLYKRRAEQ